MKPSYFKRVKTWEEALEETEEGLVPVAVKLKLLTEEIDYLPDYSYTDDANFIYGEPPCVALVMTTVFEDEDYNGSWGWCSIEENTRQTLAKFVYGEVGTEAWVFMSQHWE